MRPKLPNKSKGLFLLVAIMLAFFFVAKLDQTGRIIEFYKQISQKLNIFQSVADETQGGSVQGVIDERANVFNSSKSPENSMALNSDTTEKSGVTNKENGTSNGSVKAVEDEITQNSLVFRLKVFFLEAIHAVSAKFDSDLEVGNDVLVGNNLDLGGALTVGGETSIGGDVEIAGDTEIIGELTAPNVVYSLTAGTGISLIGTQEVTITNSDLGSTQNIFKNFKIGSNTISASSNSDTLTWEGGTGISVSNDGKTITIAASGSDLNVSGWVDDGDSVRLTTTANNVGIGTDTPEYKLHVVGTSYFSGNATFAGGTVISSGINNSSGGITNAGAITGATGFTSSGTITLSSLSTGIVHSNVNGVLSVSALNLSGGGTEITGTLPVGSGGTGVTSVNTGDILYASGANTLAALGVGAEGEVLTVSGGVPNWGSSGSGSPCATCIVDNPGSTQTITPTAATATGLVIKQALAGSVDSFRVESNDGTNVYFRIDSSGNVTLGNQTSSGVFTVSPTSTDPISISPAAQGAGQFTGTITSADLTANRTWTFPDASGIVCLASGNCSGTSAGIGGSGTTNYLSKWNSTYGLTDSLIYDNGTNVGIGSTSPGAKLDVVGTLKVSALTTLAADLQVNQHATISGSLLVDQAVDLNSTLGVTGATTLGSTLDVTGLATFGGNVGIGTTSPAAKLDIVSGHAKFSPDYGIRTVSGSYTNSISLYGSSTGTMTLTSNYSGSAEGGINFATGGSSTVMRIDKSGNVGIGTTAPGARLQVVGGGSNSLPPTSGSTAGTGLIARIGGNASLSDAVLDFGWGDTGGSNWGSWIQATNKSNYSLNYALLLNPNGGNVGVGTTAPGAKFDVSGNIRMLNPSVGIFATDVSGFAGRGINFFNYNFELYSGNYPIKFNTSSVERMRLDTAGNVGIGTTAPTGLLNVSGAATGQALAILNQTGDQAIFAASVSGTTKFIIANDGNVGIGTTSPGSKFDIKDGNLILTDSDIAHGMVDFIPTAAFAQMKSNHSTYGGLNLAGVSTANISGMLIEGIIGVDDPTDTTAAVWLSGSKKSGVNRVALGASETVLQVATGPQGSGSTLLTVLGSGNVGIGTTAPSSNLDIFKATTDGNTSEVVRISNQGYATGRNAIAWYNTQGLMTSARIYSEPGASYNASKLFFDVADASRTLQQRLTIDTSGNVGIGSTSPAYKLDIVSTVADSPLLRAIRSGTSRGLILDTNGNATFTSVSSTVDGIFNFSLETALARETSSGNTATGVKFAIPITLTAGSDANNSLTLSGTVNQSGGTGITRGLYLNQTITAASDYRALEVASGKAIFGGNVGIGTTSATRPLKVQGTAEVTGDTWIGGLLALGTTQNAGITKFGTAGIGFRTGDTASTVVITDGGNVGIGTTVPTELLHVAKESAGDGASALFEGDVKIKYYQKFVSSSSSYHYLDLLNAGDDYVFQHHDATGRDFIFQNQNAELVRILNSGNIGVGTTSPAAKLDISGDLAVHNATISASYAGSIPLAVKATTSQTANLTEWQNSAGTATTVITKDGFLDFSNSATPATWNTVFKLNSWVTGLSEVAGGFGNGFIKLDSTGRSFLNLVTDNGTNSLLSGGVDGENARRFAMTGTGMWQVGGGSADYDTYLERISGGGWKMSSTGSNATLQVDGNLGIGTSAPIGKLHVTGATTGKALTILNETGDQAIFAASASGTNRFLIQNDGNVGIGSTSPAFTLDVNGTLGVEQYVYHRGDTDTLFRFGNDQWSINAGGVEFVEFVEGTADAVTFNETNADINFVIDGDTNEAVFFVDGALENVGIGSATPGQKLDVVGNARFSAVGSGAYANDLNLTADGTLTTSASDIRLKENLTKLSNTEILNKVLQLQTYAFDWKNGGSHDLGMIAQEVAQIIPEITFTNKTDGYMGINYSRLPTLLVSAVQEQSTQILGLSVEIDENGQVISQLRSELDEAKVNSADAKSIEEQLSPYASITTQVWTFLQEVVFSVKTKFMASVEFVTEVAFGGSVKFNQDTVGRFIVPAGAKKVAISFESEFSEVPTVYLSVQSQVVGGYILESVDTQGFIVKFDQPQDSDKIFDWLAVLSSRNGNAAVEVIESSSTNNDQQVPSAGNVSGATTEASHESPDSSQDDLVEDESINSTQSGETTDNLSTESASDSAFLQQ